MAGHGEKRSRNQEAAIAALLGEPSIKKAAAKAGVAEKTLRTWMADPDFASAYRAARQLLVESARGRLQDATGEAVEALRKLLKSKHQPTIARAALGILAQAHKSLELDDHEERLAALEKLLNAERNR
jgi:hypothetical protein